MTNNCKTFGQLSQIANNYIFVQTYVPNLIRTKVSHLEISSLFLLIQNELNISNLSVCYFHQLERFHTHWLCWCRMQCYQMESFTRSPVRQKCRRRLRHSEMQPEVGTTAGLSVTMFLNEPFHTQLESCR